MKWRKISVTFGQALCFFYLSSWKWKIVTSFVCLRYNLCITGYCCCCCCCCRICPGHHVLWVFTVWDKRRFHWSMYLNGIIKKVSALLFSLPPLSFLIIQPCVFLLREMVVVFSLGEKITIQLTPNDRKPGALSHRYMAKWATEPSNFQDKFEERKE